MSYSPLVWLEGKLDSMAAQLVAIGNALDAQGADYGLTPEEIDQWHNGAAMNNYLQIQLTSAVRDYSSALTNLRGELQFDKTPREFVLTPFSPPAPPTMRAAPPLQTDFCDFCNALYKRMKLTGGLTDSVAKSMGFLVPATDVAPPNPATMKPRVSSLMAEAGGKVTVTVERQNQPQIHFRLTLDSGEVLDKTLPNSKASFTLPVDRVHRFDAIAIYSDRNGDDYGQWSDAKSDTSAL